MEILGKIPSCHPMAAFQSYNHFLRNSSLSESVNSHQWETRDGITALMLTRKEQQQLQCPQQQELLLQQQPQHLHLQQIQQDLAQRHHLEQFEHLNRIQEQQTLGLQALSQGHLAKVHRPVTAVLTESDLNQCFQIEATVEEKVRAQNTASPVLPPCRVCGDRSTGFHYGATTCEACKGFFRRSLARQREFRCVMGTQSCEIQYGGKAPCPYCRLVKCIAVGMSRKGIKRGRYTLSQKTNHILEVKALREMMKASSAFTEPQPEGNTVEYMSAPEVAPAEAEEEEFLKHIPLIKTVLNAYLQHCRYPIHIENHLEDIQQEYLKTREFEDPNSARLKIDDLFTSVFDNNSMVKDKLQMLYKRIQFINGAIKKLVSFAKNLPGFRSLPMNDQISLIKAVQFDWWFLSVYPGISPERKLYTTPLGDTVAKQEIAAFMSPVFAESLFHLAATFKDLNLSYEENALVMGLSVVSTDGCDKTENQAAIESIYHSLGEGLYHLTKERYPEQPSRFGRIVAAVTELRSADGPHAEAKDIALGCVENMKVQVPPLLLEMWAGIPNKQDNS